MRWLSSLKARLVHSVHNEPAAILYSVCIALVLWFVISVTIYPTSPKTIREVPIIVDITGTAAEEAGLKLISTDVEDTTLDVTIQGNRSQIGSLTKDDVSAKVIIPDDIVSSGEYTLDVTITSKRGVDFVVESQTVRTVTLFFDKVVTSEFPVTVNAPNVKAADDMALDTLECNPERIKITGPETSLALIDHVTVNVLEERVLSTSYNFTNCTNYTIYDKSGAIVEPTGLTVEEGAKFSVKALVYTKATLPLAYTLKNVPSNFDEEFLRKHLKFTPEEITILSQDSSITELESWSRDLTIPLNTIGKGYSKDFTLIMPEGYENYNNLGSATLSLDMTGLATKTIHVSDVVVTNAPSTYDVSTANKGQEITLIGPEADIKNLKASDVVLSVDLTGYTIKDSTFNYDVTVTTPEYNRVWAVGSYTVWVDAKEKTAP